MTIVSVLSERLARLTDPAQFDLSPLGPGDILDLGCGNRKYPGAVGLDLSADTEADIVHDLDDYPWPIADSSFDQILMQDVIEPVAEPYRLMEELHRIARPDAVVQLRTPHFSSMLAYGDPTHRHYLSALAVSSLADPGFAHYGLARFDLEAVVIDSWLPYRALGVQWAANRWPAVYEKYFAFIFPAMNIRARFRVRK